MSDGINYLSHANISFQNLSFLMIRGNYYFEKNLKRKEKEKKNMRKSSGKMVEKNIEKYGKYSPLIR